MGDKIDPPPPPKPQLHPVFTVSNNQNKIRILDGTKVTYASWVRLFTLHAKGYKVLSHIDGTKPPNADAANYDEWCEIDAHVLQWIYGTLSDDLLPRVLVDESTAYEAWKRVENIFLNNKGARLAALEHEFNNLKLANLPSLDAYCQRLRDIAGQMKDVGAAVDDNRLVLQLVSGLPSSYDTVAAYINQTLPNFETARSMLELELHRQSARDEPPEALVASQPQTIDSSNWTEKPKSASTQPRSSSYRGNNYNPQFNNNSNNNRRRDYRGGNNKPRSDYQQAASTPSVAPPAANWPMASPWPYPWTPSPMPGQAYVAETDTPQLTDIDQALQAMNLQPPVDGPWFMDTGASSHLTSDAVRQFTKDNNVSVEFDPFSFSVKDLQNGTTILRSDSTGELYPVSTKSNTFSPTSTSGHGLVTLSTDISKHKRLPFHDSNSVTFAPFDIIHVDLWTSPVLSKSCYKYYLILIDNFTQFVWVYPLTAKSEDEFRALKENHTWDLVPKPSDANIIRCLWLYQHKFNSDGSLQWYKARLVVNGKSQQVGVDCEETFSPVIKPTTIRTVLSLAVSRSWPIHQLDVKNAFLHGDLAETVYMHQQPGFVDKSAPTHVYRLRKSLYGLKQAPRAWFQRFATFVLSQGFWSSVCDSSLFIYHSGSDIAYLLLYVDDIILTASNTTLLHRIIHSLSQEFSMTDLGVLNHFLGITVTRTSKGLFLSQSKYAEDILARASMLSCNPTVTHVDVGSKLSATAGPLISDPSLYRSLAGALKYLTITQPDIAYAVQQSSSLTITAYSDTDWGGCPDSRRSISGCCVFLGNNLVSWSSKRQPTISRSSAEAEYIGVANAVVETSWLRNLLFELQVPITRATLVYCDNISVVYLAGNPVQHQRTKHIELDIHFVREKVQVGSVGVLHVPSEYQYADIFTKGLPRFLFNRFRSSLSVRSPPAPTAGAY
ncbi:uncharacterized protein LOC141587950 [Silene latifolia]|uniref:uncharacterized protein LOC141587950 n=1 Tax=Silene latifolia TaxID=37657 RepID=UPI003D784F32